MALLRAWVTDTPVTLCLDSKVGTAVLLVLVLIPISLPVPQRWGRRVWQLWSNYNDQILLSSYTHFSLRLRQANLSSSHYQHLLIQPGWQHATPTAVWVWHVVTFHILHETPAGAKIESLTDTTFSASLGVNWAVCVSRVPGDKCVCMSTFPRCSDLWFKTTAALIRSSGSLPGFTRQSLRGETFFTGRGDE